MANPQAENGHIDVAHEIAEALCRINLSAYESRVVWFVLRKTYGWHKKMDRISYSQFEEATGIHRRHLGPTIKGLINRDIITCSGNGRLLQYGLQKDYEKWHGLKPIVTCLSNETLPKEVTIEECDNNVTENATKGKERFKSVSDNVTSKGEESVTPEETLQAQEGKSLPIQGDNVTDLGLNHYRSAAKSLLKQVNTKETIQKKLTKETLQKKDKNLEILNSFSSFSGEFKDFIQRRGIQLDAKAVRYLPGILASVPTSVVIGAFADVVDNGPYKWEKVYEIIRAWELAQQGKKPERGYSAAELKAAWKQ